MAEFRSFYYEEGNAARAFEAEALPTREDLAREIREEEQRQKRVRIRTHRRNKRESRRVTTLFGIGVLLCGAFFVSYVHIQNNITTSLKHISSLETQISDIKADNAATKSRIATATDLSDIKDTAMKDLGMVYAKGDQIVYYTMDNEDYMSQYEDIK